MTCSLVWRGGYARTLHATLCVAIRAGAVSTDDYSRRRGSVRWRAVRRVKLPSSTRVGGKGSGFARLVMWRTVAAMRCGHVLGVGSVG